MFRSIVSTTSSPCTYGTSASPETLRAVPADRPRFLIVKVGKTDDVRNQGSQRIEPAGFRVHVHARKVKGPHRIDLLIRRALHQRFIRIVGLSEHRGEL